MVPKSCGNGTKKNLCYWGKPLFGKGGGEGGRGEVEIPKPPLPLFCSLRTPLRQVAAECTPFFNGGLQGAHQQPSAQLPWPPAPLHIHQHDPVWPHFRADCMHTSNTNTHTHTKQDAPKCKTLQAQGTGQLSFSSGHQNNEGDIVMWLGAFLQGTVIEIVMTGSVHGVVQSV